jgi:hypothetical protein
MGLKYAHHKNRGHLAVIDREKEQVLAKEEVKNTT